MPATTPKFGPGWVRSGRPLPTLELEIRGPDGEVLPAGETGEIYVRGDQIAGEYHGRSALDAEGWFATNDGGHLDSAGFLFVEGRLDDVIVRGGENMSPGEIEDVLAAASGCGRSRGRRRARRRVGRGGGGRRGARARGRPAAEEELQSWVQDHLRSSRMPAVVEIRDALPYNETGKLLRRVLKEDLAERGPSSSRVTPA